MSIKIKAGTCFALPVEIQDDNFDNITRIEFMFKQTENGDPLKTATWSKSGQSTGTSLDGSSEEHVILVKFTREDTYLFKQNEMFFMDTRIHYANADTNPCTNIVRLLMRETLFREGEEAE